MNDVRRRTIASFLPPEDTPLIVFAMQGGNASLTNFPAEPPKPPPPLA